MMRMGVLDAETMQPYVKPLFNSTDLQELPDFHVIARMLVNGFPQRPFVFNTIPMPEMRINKNMDQIVDSLRRWHSKPVSEVEKQINERLNIEVQ
jgi:hypothetical protein